MQTPSRSLHVNRDAVSSLHVSRDAISSLHANRDAVGTLHVNRNAVSRACEPILLHIIVHDAHQACEHI